MTEPVSAQERRTLPDAAYAGLVALLLALAGGAWALTARRMEEMGPGGGMAGMDAAAGAGLGGLGSFCLTWLLMMAAMMVPSVAPRALDSARLADADRALPSLRRAVAIIGFLAGYLLAWLAAGLVAYAVVDGARGPGGGFALDGAERYLTAGILIAAAAYELTAAKDACLRHCRSPLRAVRQGPSGFVAPLSAGVEHGVVCIGCCWAMMAALLALGLVSMAWMAVIAGVIAAEKLLPWSRAATRGTVIGLAALAIAVVFLPGR